MFVLVLVAFIVAELVVGIALGRWMARRTAWQQEPWLPYDRRRWRP